jgi:hypothetical protein
MPQGYDTVIGERGATLSAGERHRITLARALLRNPSVLVLDEPTAVLDAATEREIAESLAASLGGRTAIVITHRPALAAIARGAAHRERESRGASSGGGFVTIRVGIVASGINDYHEHVGAVQRGVFFHRDGESLDYLDRIGHGTAVAGAIREKAPCAELYAIRILERRLRATIDLLMRGLEWCLENGMHVINVSVGTANESHRAVLKDYLRHAQLQNVMLVSAAALLPGRLPGVIAVEPDAECPRESCRFSEGTFFASPYPRPIPGVPPERSLKGVSFAIANCTGLLARLLESVPASRAYLEFQEAASRPAGFRI